MHSKLAAYNYERKKFLISSETNFNILWARVHSEHLFE